MELQTVSQVSKSLGISARMLRYYEQNGLIKSLRIEGYSYRVYDNENIKRLQHIVILRKLQIPIKQIHVILSNPIAATAVDIFKKNISELQNEITALEIIKSALEIFVAKIEEISAVRLNLNLLTDDSVMKLAESLSLIQKNVKENKTMEELNKAADQLDKLKVKFVRVILMPSSTVAHVSCKIDNRNPDDPWAVYTDAKDIMDKFIDNTNLLKIKPDFRYFLTGNAEITTCEIMVTIPENLDVPAPLVKSIYPGGLFAAYTNTPENFDDWRILEAWAENNEDYEWEARCARLEEYINPRNIYGLKKTNSEYYDFLLPIKEA